VKIGFARLGRAFDRIALSLNTHFVANSGLVATTIAASVHVAAKLSESHAVHFPIVADVTITSLDPLTEPLMGGGAIAAYLGRPSSVPRKNVAADVPRSSALPADVTSFNAGTAGGSAPMSFEGQLADAIVGYYDANKGALATLLASKNVLVVNLVENAAQALVAKNPMLGLIFGGEIKALAPELVTFLGGEETAGIAALDALLHAEAAKLGG
jgi:hypothetical protein